MVVKMSVKNKPKKRGRGRPRKAKKTVGPKRKRGRPRKAKKAVAPKRKKIVKLKKSSAKPLYCFRKGGGQGPVFCVGGTRKYKNYKGKTVEASAHQQARAKVFNACKTANKGNKKAMIACIKRNKPARGKSGRRKVVRKRVVRKRVVRKQPKVKFTKIKKKPVVKRKIKFMNKKYRK